MRPQGRDASGKYSRRSLTVPRGLTAGRELCEGVPGLVNGLSGEELLAGEDDGGGVLSTNATWDGRWVNIDMGVGGGEMVLVV